MLVGIDFSDGAALALAEARRLTDRLGADLELLHVEETQGPAGWRDDPGVRAWLAALGVDAAGLTVRRGQPWVELARHARETEPVLVVVGSHGVSGFQPVALGSTAARLGVSSPFPVVVVTRAAARGRHGAAAPSPAAAASPDRRGAPAV
jgi:nucleotide-binding universal stress UspA family protein